MWRLVSVLLALFPVQYLRDLEVTPLSFDAALFRQAFNQTQDRPRLVLVMSPT